MTGAAPEQATRAVQDGTPALTAGAAEPDALATVVAWGRSEPYLLGVRSPLALPVPPGPIVEGQAVAVPIHPRDDIAGRLPPAVGPMPAVRAAGPQRASALQGAHVQRHQPRRAGACVFPFPPVAPRHSVPRFTRAYTEIIRQLSIDHSRQAAGIEAGLPVAAGKSRVPAGVPSTRDIVHFCAVPSREQILNGHSKLQFGPIPAPNRHHSGPSSSPSDAGRDTFTCCRPTFTCPACDT